MSTIPVAAHWVVVDIEGTTSPTDAVHVTLFGFAREHLPALLRERGDAPEVAAAMAQVRAEAGLPDDAGADDVMAVLTAWMDEDRKAAPLKALQGIVWEQGYASGELVPVLFPDVAPALRAWHAAGARLAVYSSGSEQAQRAWFGHGPDADLGSLIEANFDTVSAGPKREASSYARIAHALAASPADLVFLSDVVAELDAARAAGWQTVGLARAGEPQTPVWHGTHARIASFDELEYVDPGLAAAGGRLAAASSALAAQGWMQATSGNLSEVLEHAPLRVAITASGGDKRALSAFDVVEIDAAGTPLRLGRAGLSPSAEGALHARVAAVTGAGSVVHVHALSSVLAGRQWPEGVVLRDVEMLKALGRDAHGDEVRVPVIANSQDMAELGDRFEATRVEEVPGFIVAEHGLYVWGADVQQARLRTEALEWLFRWALGQA